jgi:hypothetical protein
MVAINSATLSEPMFVRIGTSPVGFVPPPHEPMNVLCGEESLASLNRENHNLKMRLAMAERTYLQQLASCQTLGVRLAPHIWANKPPGLNCSPTLKSVGLETLSDASTVDNSPEPSDTGSASGDAVSSVDVDEIEATTLIVQNIPNRYSRTTLLTLLDESGYQNLYNLVYLPTDFMTSVNFGYAFVHFVSSKVANRFKKEFHGFSGWNCNSSKTCSVDFCAEQCGLDSLIKRYQNCPVMHELVPDEYKPALFLDGQRIAFPAPTKKLKKPRMKASRELA